MQTIQTPGPLDVGNVPDAAGSSEFDRFMPLTWEDCLLPDWPRPVAARVRAIVTTRAGGVSQGVYGAGADVITKAAGAVEPDRYRMKADPMNRLIRGGLNLGFHTGDDPARVVSNRARLERLIGNRAAWLDQVHGTEVVRAEDWLAGASAEPVAAAVPPCADACITTRPGTACVVMTADCLAVLLCDRAGTAVGVAHAGWRGLLGGVLERCVERLRESTREEIIGYFGPAIGPASFEVGAEVREAFRGAARADEIGRLETVFLTRQGVAGKYWANLYELARIRLKRVGVVAIGGGNRCTVREAPHYYSYRRDRVTGRMAALIWLEDR